MKKFIKWIVILVVIVSISSYLYYDNYKYGFSFDEVSPMAAAYNIYNNSENVSQDVSKFDKYCENIVYRIMYDLNVNHKLSNEYKKMIEKDQIINLCNVEFAKYYPSKKAYEKYLNKNNYKENMNVYKPKYLFSDDKKLILYNCIYYTIKNSGVGKCSMVCRIEIEKDNNNFKIISVINVNTGNSPFSI